MLSIRFLIGAVALMVLVGSVRAEAMVLSAGGGRPASGQPAQLIHEGHAGAAQGSGVVNSVDAAAHKVNLSHGSIKTLGWPAMTMDFPVSPDADLSGLKPGSKVNFTLVHMKDGTWMVDTIQPVAGR